MVKKLLIFVSLCFVLASCISEEKEPIETSNSDGNLMQSGDIVVVNSNNDSIVLLDANGNYKTTLFSEQSGVNLSITSMAWDPTTGKLWATYDHITAGLDRIMVIDPYNLNVQTLYSNSAVFSTATINTLPGMARLKNGEILALETTGNVLEKFTSSFTRLGAPASAAMVAAPIDVVALPTTTAGQFRFLVCSTNVGAVVGTAALKTYWTATNGTTVTASAEWATSATPGTTLGGAFGASGCAYDPTNDRIAAAFSGATDGVRVFSSNLATHHWNFINATYLSTPGRVAFRKNGNVLVTDTALNHIVEISSSGQFVKTMGASILSGPNAIVVVP